VDRDGNACLIEAAAALNAHVVLMSVLGASPTDPMELFRMKAVAEERLRDSGTPWTIVRAGAFIELYCDLMRQTARRSRRPLVFGRGENRIIFASVPDVAAAVDRALVDPSCRGTVIEVGHSDDDLQRACRRPGGRPRTGGAPSPPRPAAGSADAGRGRRHAAGAPGQGGADDGRLRPHRLS